MKNKIDLNIGQHDLLYDKKCSVIRIKPKPIRLMTNAKVSYVFATETIKNLERAFPGSTFQVIPYVNNLKVLHPDELIENYIYKVDGKSMKLTEISINNKTKRKMFIFNDKLIVNEIERITL